MKTKSQISTLQLKYYVSLYMILQILIGVSLNAFYVIHGVQPPIAYISLVVSPLIYMALQMQIGNVVLMIASLLVVILSSLVRRWFHDNQASNTQLLAPPPKLSIKLWQMTLLRLSSFNISWEICRFILLLLLLFGVIISMLLIYMQILFFILVLNTLRLTIILYETKLRRKRFRLALSPLTINLPMFLLSRFLLLRLLLSDSNFRSILHPQLEKAYYRMYLYKKYYRYTI